MDIQSNQRGGAQGLDWQSARLLMTFAVLLVATVLLMPCVIIASVAVTDWLLSL